MIEPHDQRNPEHFARMPSVHSDASGCDFATHGRHFAIRGNYLGASNDDHGAGKKIEELSLEMEKLRKLLSHFINGHRSEKRILTGPNQDWLPFETHEEFQAARAEAEAQAEAVIQTYTVEREVQNKKPRNESLPSHLRREEQIIEGDATQKTCSTHGERTIIGYDTTETLVHKRPELYVLVKKYPKYACPGNPECGIASPERPTSLVEGDRYDTSVAATIVEAKWFHHMPIYRQQDQFAGSGWTPSRSTLSNIVSQVDFVVSPFIEFMTKLVQQDIGVGIDDTSCRMLLPPQRSGGNPGRRQESTIGGEDRRSACQGRRQPAGQDVGLLGPASGALQHLRLSRLTASRWPRRFFRESRCKVQGDCFSGNRSVVLHSDERLEFVACWGHARRKVVEATTYRAECELLLAMIQALYDVETRAKEMTWQDRQALRLRESTIILDAIRKWLDSEPLGAVLPKSDFAEAVRYLRNHWEALTVYVRDGRIPIDNNSSSS